MAFIEGNSRCAIEINGETLRKISPDRDYSPRLQRQVEKQREFGTYNRLWFCRTPKVLAERWDGEIYQVEMQYSNGLDFIEFIKHASRDSLDLAADHLDRIVTQSIETSAMTRVPYATLRDKMASIAPRCAAVAGVDIPPLFEKLPTDDLDLPVGHCHGDLTLSNILFRQGGITVIDFLDNFIETPLQDMVKVRQDTCFLWSCQLYRQPFDKVRTELALRYMDQRVHEMFSRHDFYRRHYAIFQFVNLARVLPYCQTPQLQQHVVRCLKTVVEQHV